MLLLTILLQIFSPAPAHAAVSCKASLSKILKDAKAKVNSSYAAGDDCRKDALNGQNASDGCNGGLEVTQLKLLLAPYYYDAQKVCKGVCADEGKQQACESMMTTEFMLSKGINGLQSALPQKVNYSPIDGLRYEDYNSYSEWLDAVARANQGPNTSVIIGI